VNKAIELLRLALTVSPGIDHPGCDDDSWEWAWDELSGEAQDEIRRVNDEIGKFLEEAAEREET